MRRAPRRRSGIPSSSTDSPATARKISGTNGTKSAPVTTYSAEAAELALAGKTASRADPRAQAYTHIVRTDSNGYFNATGLPSGTFYVAGVIQLPDGTRSPLILSQVQVGRGQTRSIELSR